MRGMSQQDEATSRPEGYHVFNLLTLVIAGAITWFLHDRYGVPTILGAVIGVVLGVAIQMVVVVAINKRRQK
jgi:tetrahydromethanopterin S-methyltransferase subunit E